MSRYLIPTQKNKKGKFKVVVGWDGPLETFFAQVFDLDRAKGEEENLVAWFGADPCRLPAITDLKTAVAEWAEIAPEIEESLEKDCKNSLPPSELQLFLRSRLK